MAIALIDLISYVSISDENILVPIFVFFTRCIAASDLLGFSLSHSLYGRVVAIGKLSWLEVTSYGLVKFLYFLAFRR